MYGPAELALVSELAVPDAKLALFQTACFNPTIAGSPHAGPMALHPHAVGLNDTPRPVRQAACFRDRSGNGMLA